MKSEVFLDRYALRDAQGNLLEQNIEDAFKRVAQGDPKIFKIMEEGLFYPGGRILAGVGVEGVSLYNCLVLPCPKDSRKGIMDSVAEMVECMSRSSGVGINLSSLRPSGARVRGVNGTSSGPLAWACVYSEATKSVEQGGSRQGALMLMLNDWHPDILDFITYKREHPGKLTKANLSVGISDKFMKAVREDKDWELYFPDTTDSSYNKLWDGDIDSWVGNKIPYKTVKAREIWDLIIESAHASGEPGVVFLERYNELSNTKGLEKIIATNPCGEEGLSAYGVCNLGSINLSKFVVDGQVDYIKLQQTVEMAVKFLDKVIDLSPYHFTEIWDNQKRFRKIGLGTMGLAEMLIKLKIRYGSEESLKFIDSLYHYLAECAYLASSGIAAKKGSYPAFDPKIVDERPFLRNLREKTRESIKKHGLRNSHILTQAPTGTISILAGTSSGIEPYFAFKYNRADRMGVREVTVPIAEGYDELPDYFVTAHDLTPEEHVKVQATIQKWVDSSISKTVNAPNESTTEDTRRVFDLAYDLGCKGIAYYRDGSLDGVLTKPKEFKLMPRPTKMNGKAFIVKTGFGNLTLDVHEFPDGVPFEVIINVGANGSDLTADAVGIGMTISSALRAFHDPQERLALLSVIAEKLLGVGGSSFAGFGEGVTSLPSAVAKGLKRYLEDNEIEIAVEENFDRCPQCGNNTFAKGEGCSACLSCGYSLCS